MKKLILTPFTLALALSAFAADATGKYNGKITMDLSGVRKMIQQKSASVPADKKAMVAQQIKMLDQTEKMMGKATISLELKKDHTLSITQTMNGKAQSDKGKWTQMGNKVKMFGFSNASQGPKDMTGAISPNGKSIFFDLTDEMKKEAAKKGAPPGFSGKMSINFTKA
jgi:hypothetical protein